MVALQNVKLKKVIIAKLQVVLVPNVIFLVLNVLTDLTKTVNLVTNKDTIYKDLKPIHILRVCHAAQNVIKILDVQVQHEQIVKNVIQIIILYNKQIYYIVIINVLLNY